MPEYKHEAQASVFAAQPFHLGIPPWHSHALRGCMLPNPRRHRGAQSSFDLGHFRIQQVFHSAIDNLLLDLFAHFDRLFELLDLFPKLPQLGPMKLVSNGE